MRRLLVFQIILVVLLTLILAILEGYLAAKAGLFGGMIALMNTGLILLHDKRAQRSNDDANRVIRYVYLCAVERMLLTIILFAVGLVALKLMPLPLLLGFIAAQLAAFLNGLSR